MEGALLALYEIQSSPTKATFNGFQAEDKSIAGYREMTGDVIRRSGLNLAQINILVKARLP